MGEEIDNGPTAETGDKFGRIKTLLIWFQKVFYRSGRMLLSLWMLLHSLNILLIQSKRLKKVTNRGRKEAYNASVAVDETTQLEVQVKPPPVEPTKKPGDKESPLLYGIQPDVHLPEAPASPQPPDRPAPCNIGIN